MFDKIRNMIGAMSVVETDTDIIISGISAHVMSQDISRIWGTSRINMYMFNSITKNAMSFPKFFAPDVVYAIDVILKNRYRRSSIRTLSILEEKLMTQTWLAKTTQEVVGRLDFNMLNNMVFTPLDHQTNFLNAYDTLVTKYNLNGFLLAGAAGSGKTFTSLAAAECLHADLVVILCPKNALENVWEKSVGISNDSCFKAVQPYWKSNSGKDIKGNERFLMGNYEAMEAVEAAMLKRMSQLHNRGKVVVILDESHNLNEVTSMRSARFIELTRKSKSNNVIWLSGTPIKALGSESIPLFRCIDPLFTPLVEERFKKIYGKNASKGLDILSHRLGLMSFKVEKKELNLAPPEMMVQKVSMPTGHKYTLSAVSDDMVKFVQQRKIDYAATKQKDESDFYSYLAIFEKTVHGKDKEAEYSKYRTCLTVVIRAHAGRYLKDVPDEIIFTNKYEKTIAQHLPRDIVERFRHVKSIVKYVSLKIQGEALGRVLGRKRIECHVDLVDYIPFEEICESTEKKTIVFTSFVEVLQRAEVIMREQGLTPAIVYGGTNSNLTSIVKDFEVNPNTNPLVATYASLSTAVPLTMADTMILVNNPFRAYIQEQAISRIHRLNATTQTRVWTIALDTGLEPNLSTRSNDILAWSQQQVEKIMGIKSPFEVLETSAFESLDEMVRTEQLFITISAETYDISETISFEEIAKETKIHAFVNW